MNLHSLTDEYWIDLLGTLDARDDRIREYLTKEKKSYNKKDKHFKESNPKINERICVTHKKKK